MRKLLLMALPLALAACSSAPRPLVPDTPEGPASYVCYNSMVNTPDEVKAIAGRQCSRWGMTITGVIGQEFTPLRCGLLTPEVAAFRCGRGGAGY